jgi:hypothetical protein
MAYNVNPRQDVIQTVDIDGVSVEDLTVERWPLSSIPIEPFLIEEPADNHGKYLDGPITPHILRLQPGDPDTATRFARKLGILGLSRWAEMELRNEEPEARTLWEAISHEQAPEEESRDSWITRNLEQLSAAWTHEATAQAFKSDIAGIRLAWTAAADPDRSLEDVALLAFLETAPPARALPMSLVPHQGNLVASPAHALARSWMELAHLLRTQRLRPARCGHCRQLFPPKRDGQQYCPGTSCARDHYRAYNQNEHRREYQKMYKRYRRGAISRDEWDAWRDANPDPRQAEPGRRT